MDRTFAEDVLARAVAVLGDVRAADDDREDAGRVIQAILLRAHPTEADLADLIGALGKALHVDLAVRRVLGEVQRLQPPQVVERAGRGVQRLMAQSFHDGNHEALAELLLVTLEEARWLHIVRDEWGKAATTWAANGLPGRKYPLAPLVSGWLHAFGKVPTWLGEIAEAHLDLISSSLLPRETRWQLHRAAPSVHGWRSLVSGLGWTPVIEPTLFDHEADVAVETLRQAIGESTDEATRLRLCLWFRELTGEP